MSVTWYNRSVGISGSVEDFSGRDVVGNRVCVIAYTGPNGSGEGTPVGDDSECRTAPVGSGRTFGFAIGGAPEGGFQSVVVAHYEDRPDTDAVLVATRTRNQPAA